MEENMTISIFAMVISIISIIITYLIYKWQSQLLVFSDYTKRNQDIMLHLYSDKENKDAYHRLYFDLCCDEYYLHEKGFISNNIWKHWEYGMKITMKITSIQGAWICDAVYYDKYPEFQKFFKKIIEESKENKY